MSDLSIQPAPSHAKHSGGVPVVCSITVAGAALELPILAGGRTSFPFHPVGGSPVGHLKQARILAGCWKGRPVFFRAAEQGLAIHELEPSQSLPDRERWAPLVQWLEAATGQLPAANGAVAPIGVSRPD